MNAQPGLSTPPESARILFNATAGLPPSVTEVLQRKRLLVLEPCAGRGALLLAFAAERARIREQPGGSTIVLACETDATRMRELRATCRRPLQTACPGIDVHLCEHDWMRALRSGRHADRTPDGMRAWRGVPLELRRRLLRDGWSLPHDHFNNAFDLVLLHPPWYAVNGKRTEPVWPQHVRVALEMVSSSGGIAAVLPPHWWRDADADLVRMAARGFRLHTSCGSLGDHELVWLTGRDMET